MDFHDFSKEIELISRFHALSPEEKRIVIEFVRTMGHEPPPEESTGENSADSRRDRR